MSRPFQADGLGHWRRANETLGTSWIFLHPIVAGIVERSQGNLLRLGVFLGDLDGWLR